MALREAHSVGLPRGGNGNKRRAEVLARVVLLYPVWPSMTPRLGSPCTWPRGHPSPPPGRPVRRAITSTCPADTAHQPFRMTGTCDRHTRGDNSCLITLTHDQRRRCVASPKCRFVRCGSRHPSALPCTPQEK